MFIAYAIAALFLAVVIHEGAHAVCMVRYGIRIKRFGIGLPFPPRPKLSFRLFGTEMNLHPLLIGAYVEPEDENAVEALSASKQNHISAAGVVANLVTAGIAYVDISFMDGDLRLAAIWLLPTLLAAFFSRPVSNFLILPIGIGMVAMLIHTIAGISASDIGRPLSEGGSLGGPATIVGELAAFQLSFLQMFAVISLALGITNAMPIYPLDGGRIFLTTLKKFKTPKVVISAVRTVGVMALIALFALVIFSDAKYLGLDISRIIS